MVEQQNPTPDQPNSRSWVSRQLVRLRALFQRDVIVAQVGEGAENVAVGKNIFQINVGGHNITPYLLALIGVTLVVVGFLTWPLVEPTLYPARMASGFNIAVADVGLLRGGLPASAGPMWFKVLQTCEKGSIDWAEVPASGTSTKGCLLYTSPSPRD